MKRGFYISLITLLLLVGCNNAKYITVKQVKPINRNSYYNPKKDKKKKRVKYVRVKILKKSPEVKAPPPKKVKPAKAVKSEEMDSTEDLEAPTNEQDTTGLL